MIRLLTSIAISLIVITGILSGINADWYPWSQWSTCSVTCENGYQVRLRNCSFPVDGRLCPGSDVDVRICSTDCTVDGQWGEWYPWSTCCNGHSVRLRDCSDPKPGIWGHNCTGSDVAVKTCSVQECNVGKWGSWHPWSSCSVSCGADGQSVRLRDCYNPSPLYTCTGQDVNIITCNTQCTPIDGGWGSWHPWSTCSATCGHGYSVRLRNCDQPRPENGGTPCNGDATEIQTCTGTCGVDGGWTPWMEWTQCDKTCGDGYHFRLRHCTDSAPGGQNCPGLEAELKPCLNITTNCPVDGVWSVWSSWGVCSSACTMKRSRTCSSPLPQYGGMVCVGDVEEVTTCTGPADPNICVGALVT